MPCCSTGWPSSSGRSSTTIPASIPTTAPACRGSPTTHLVDDLFGLIDHLNVGRAFLFGLSFGSTIALKALHREPRRFPRAAVQGGFAHRTFTAAERWALRLGRLVPGTVARLPLRRRSWPTTAGSEFPALLDDRWDYYIEQNGLTPIRSLAHRVDLLTGLDLRPILPAIPTEILLLQGNEDRIVPRRDFEVLQAALPKAEAVIMPTVGHQPHLTHAEVMAQLVHQWLFPAPRGRAAARRRAERVRSRDQRPLPPRSRFSSASSSRSAGLGGGAGLGLGGGAGLGLRARLIAV